jgi:cephalosporin hydroxylase
MWATILAQVNPEGRVISIDIVDGVTKAKDLPIVRERVEYLVGSSTSPEILTRVKQRIEGKRVLVILDSDHSRDHVFREMELYSPFIEVGGYMIVQDSNINGHPVYPSFGPGPMEAIEDFLKINSGFEIDKGRERLLHTMHPNGYLKRVRAASEPAAARDK